MLGTLKVEVLTEGVHSGDASGVVPAEGVHRRGVAVVLLEDEESDSKMLMQRTLLSVD